MRNRYSNQPDPEWQRQTALRKVDEARQGYIKAGRPVPLTVISPISVPAMSGLAMPRCCAG